MHQTVNRKKVNKLFIINIIKTVWNMGNILKNMQTTQVSIWSNKQVGLREQLFEIFLFCQKKMPKKHLSFKLVMETQLKNIAIEFQSSVSTGIQVETNLLTF